MMGTAIDVRDASICFGKVTAVDDGSINVGAASGPAVPTLSAAWLVLLAAVCLSIAAIRLRL